MGGIHRLVLMGLAPELARHYASVGGARDEDTVALDFLDTVRRHPGYLRDALRVAPQTNDIGRSALLLAGLFEAIEGDRAVRLLGVGSAGGLNLLLDKYRYEFGEWSWGDRDSPAVVRGDWSGASPDEPERLNIVERRGCDVAPVDVTDPEQRLRLLSFIWPDQVERFDRTNGAIDIAQSDPPLVERADAVDWLSDRLAEEVPRKTLTVIQHSIMWQYLTEETKSDLSSIIEGAGNEATTSRPLAHVSVEPPPKGWEAGGPMVRVTRWPGGRERVVGTGHAHGTWVNWKG
jgi:hypothetical protein